MNFLCEVEINLGRSKFNRLRLNANRGIIVHHTRDMRDLDKETH